MEITPSGWFGYSNAVAAWNGDVLQSGILLRADLGTGQYHYSSRRFAYGTSIDKTFHGDATLADLMIGYSAAFGPVTVKAYLGGEYANHTVTPGDPDNSVSGDQFGVRVLVESWWNITDGQWLATSLSYSSAFDAYQVRSQWGIRLIGDNGPDLLTGLAAGLEESVLGNSEYNQARLGGFVSLPVTNVGEVRLSAGASSNWQTVDGAYAQINVFTRF